MALLECKNVCVNYGSFEACKNVTFQINQGDYVCVVGANGSGKSTLVQATLGLTKIKSGSILRNKIGIGYLPQKNIISRDFPATVKEVVLSGCTANEKIFFSKNDRENAKKQMARLGLDSIDRLILTTMIKNYNGGPVGLETLAATVGEEAITLEDVYEPYLMQLGFLTRTPRGRCVTQLAYDHLHIPYDGQAQFSI